MGEYAAVSPRLARRSCSRAPSAVAASPAAAAQPGAWPGYTPRPSVSVWRLARGAGRGLWDFSVYGGSFGEQDATALCAAAGAGRAASAGRC